MSFANLIARVDRIAMDVFGDKDANGDPVSITYAPAVGASVPVIGIFDEQYVLAKGTAYAGVEALGPAVFLRLEDLPLDPEDDDPVITIRGNEYSVVERRPDGLGGIVLVLRFVAVADSFSSGFSSGFGG
jgi:hypothetical protein